MWRKWFPWRFMIKKVAQRQGFLDPMALLSKIQRFAQPSEVAAPVELIRLATVLQARGLMNVQAIQHNLDWIWPYWVVRQFDPRDTSFIPRAFSLTHINLTHRNWTAVGIPDLAQYPLVDPRGLLTPFYDGWSLDAWIMDETGGDILPSQAKEVLQKMELLETPWISTQVDGSHAHLLSRVSVQIKMEEPLCIFQVEAGVGQKAWLVVSLRPFNPEGVSEVERIALLEGSSGWKINKHQEVYFNEAPERQYLSNYQEGDVYQKISQSRFSLAVEPSGPTEVECKAGMASAAAAFRIPSGGVKQIEIQIPFNSKISNIEKGGTTYEGDETGKKWKSALQDYCQLQTAHDETQYLYETTLRALILLSPGTEVFPGPYTYKHFWFRDASFILHALLLANLSARVEKILDSFPSRQTLTGYFRSQDGEWDSNGQVLWIFSRFCQLTGTGPKAAWKDAIRKGAVWIKQKRLPEDLKEIHAGLFPAGFSAEHLGPNDYYYWDNFWGVEGLLAAFYLMKRYGETEEAGRFRETANHFMNCIEKSLVRVEERLKTAAMPASPYRRLDTGAVGSLAAGYPLSLWAPDDSRVIKTVEYLLKNHFINGGFFHEMSHSGINPYLTLSIAQILLRNGDLRYANVLRSVQKMASPTGQWPEAIHPQTFGGCMGDGQHIWASAEWLLMMRNCFVREEEDRLILCSGILPEWHAGAEEISFGKTPTPYGPLGVRLHPDGSGMKVSWEAQWRGRPPEIEIRLPGYPAVKAAENETAVLVKKGERR